MENSIRIKKFNLALDEFIKLTKEQYKDKLQGIIVTGSLIKKQLSKNSDIDVFMLIKDNGKRIRGSKTIDGIEIEYFMNPRRQIEADMAKEIKMSKKITLEILNDGKIVYDKKGDFSVLKNQAQKILKKKLIITKLNLFSFKYFISDYLKDIEDNYLDKDYLALLHNTTLLLNHIIEGYCKLKNIRYIKPKYLWKEIAKKDKKIIKLMEGIYFAGNPEIKLATIKKLSNYVLKKFGGPLPENYKIENDVTY